MEERLIKIEKNIAEIKARNSSVEADKAWETSVTRRLILICLTYLSIGIYMWAVKIERPWLNAIVPAIGFTLSTLTLPIFKNFWLNRFYRQDKH